MLLTGKFQRLVPTIVCCFVFHIALFGQHDDSWTELIEKYAQLMEKGEYLNALTAIEQAARIAKDFSPSDSRKWQSTLQLADTLVRVGLIDDALKVYNSMLAGELVATRNEATHTQLLLDVGR